MLLSLGCVVLQLPPFNAVLLPLGSPSPQPAAAAECQRTLCIILPKSCPLSANSSKTRLYLELPALCALEPVSSDAPYCAGIGVWEGAEPPALSSAGVPAVADNTRCLRTRVCTSPPLNLSSETPEGALTTRPAPIPGTFLAGPEPRQRQLCRSSVPGQSLGSLLL